MAGTAERCEATVPGRGAGTIENMQDDDARRVWLLWDCEDLVSVHATEAGAELACAERTAEVLAGLGEAWVAGRPLHISVSWCAVQD